MRVMAEGATYWHVVLVALWLAKVVATEEVKVN